MLFPLLFLPLLLLLLLLLWHNVDAEFNLLVSIEIGIRVNKEKEEQGRAGWIPAYSSSSSSLRLFLLSP